jgi:hypothetical protein
MYGSKYKPDLVAPIGLDSDSTGPLSVSDKLSAGLFSLVCANCSGSFSEDSLIFLNISSKVLTLRLGLYLEHTQQNIEPPYPDIAKLTVMDDTVKRKLLSSKWNDSHIFKFPSRYIN